LKRAPRQRGGREKNYLQIFFVRCILTKSSKPRIFMRPDAAGLFPAIAIYS
jgi:hypothetical protein